MVPTKGRAFALAMLAMVLVFALCAAPADAQMGRVSNPHPPTEPGTFVLVRLRLSKF